MLALLLHFGFTLLIRFPKLILASLGNFYTYDWAWHTYAFIADDGALFTTALRGAKAEAEAKKRAVAATVNFILTRFIFIEYREC